MPAGKEREGLESGTLPKAGANKLNRIFWAVEEKLLAQGVAPKAAATRASQIAWARIKKLYYKRGKKWVKRKHPKTAKTAKTAKPSAERMVAANPSRTARRSDRARTRADLRAWITEPGTGTTGTRRRSEAWLQVDRAIEAMAAAVKPIDRSSLARFMELQRRTAHEPEEFNDLTVTERIELLDGRIGAYQDRTRVDQGNVVPFVSPRSSRPNSASSELKRQLMR